MKKIVFQLTNFPTRHPRHGGQLRAHYTARALESAGFVVERMPVFVADYYPAAGSEPAVNLLPALPYRRFPEAGQVSDMTVSELAATDNGGFANFAARLGCRATGRRDAGRAGEGRRFDVGSLPDRLRRQ